jgi:hypothetical protein
MCESAQRGSPAPPRNRQFAVFERFPPDKKTCKSLETSFSIGFFGASRRVRRREKDAASAAREMQASVVAAAKARQVGLYALRSGSGRK